MNSTGVYGSLTHLSLHNKCDCHTYWSAYDVLGTFLLPLPVLSCFDQHLQSILALYWTNKFILRKYLVCMQARVLLE